MTSQHAQLMLFEMPMKLGPRNRDIKIEEQFKVEAFGKTFSFLWRMSARIARGSIC
jgi:hypothetical protein